jgi:hypothetical protein
VPPGVALLHRLAGLRTEPLSEVSIAGELENRVREPVDIPGRNEHPVGVVFHHFRDVRELEMMTGLPTARYSNSFMGEK